MGDLLLPVQWQMIGELGDDHLRQHARPRRALLDRLRRLVGRLHRAIAGVLQPHILDHFHHRRDELVAFAGLFGDQPQMLAAALAVLLGFGQIVDNPFPHQLPRQRLSPEALFCLWFLRLDFFFGDRLGFFFLSFFRMAGLPQRLEQGQLILGELFALAVPLRIQKFPQQALVLVLFRGLLLQPLAQLAHDLVQHVDLLRQRVGINGEHGVLSA